MLEYKRICNGCGKDITPNAQTGFKEGFSSRISFDYGSKFDEYVMTLDLCDKCLQEIVLDHLLIDPLIYSGFGGEI
jgi:hypothetical protein